MSRPLEELLGLTQPAPGNVTGLQDASAATQLTRRVGRSDIAPIRRNLLEQAYAEFGNLVGRASQAVRPAPNQQYGLGFGEAARWAGNQGREFVANWWDSAASGFEDSSNKLPMVRAENGLMSLQVDPRMLDMVDTATLGAFGVSRVARGAIQGTEQAIREFLEAGVRSGGQIIGGGRSKTANLAMRDRAIALDQRMPDSKAKRDMIFRETGWWKGKDNQWRYEISDEGATLNGDFVSKGSWNGKLSEVLDHPRLFEAYPHLRDTRVELVIDPNAPRGGHFDGANNVIVMRAPDAESMRKGLIHEGTHGVQYDEGFAPGGTPESAQERIRRTLENDPYLDPKDQLTLDQAAKLAALHDDPVSAYRHLAGETEARVGERRIDMTEAERRARAAYKDFDTPEQDQLVLTGMRDKPVSMIDSGGDSPLSVIARDFMREKGLADPAEASSQHLTRVNIGLMKGRTGELYSVDEAVEALRDLGIEPREYGVAGSKTEPTLIAELPRPITAPEMDTLAARLDQEAIAQKVGDAGELYGPKAADWGPFNDEFFLDLDNIRRVDKDKISKATRSEPDIAKSMLSAMTAKGKNGAKAEPPTEADLKAALANRARYRSEPNATPGPDAPPEEWAAFGDAHGVDLRVSEPKEIAPGVSIPGGLDGKFTIADLFELKSMKIDPSTLPREVHDALMQKLIRTYDIKNPDPVDVFNRLAFAQLSPNAPLLQNEFLMQRLRASSMDDIRKLASREGQDDLAKALDAESGVGAASRGGMGVKGTADLSNLATLARAVIEKPEMFRPQPGETLRDVGLRVMNQIPGLGPKTVSLGVPWLDLPHANTSAVDLHMIRNNYERLITDSRVGADFRERMAAKLGSEPTTRAVRAAIQRDPRAAEQAAIEIIGGSSRSKVYRSAKTGDVNPEMPGSLQPNLLWREPEKATFFNEFYDRIVDFVNDSRGADPALALFPEQWRLWDGYRGRVEPHEFAHPDWRKLPKQSFTEMQNALKANREAGFGDTGNKDRGTVDWRRLYYGNASPELLALMAAGGGAAAALPLLADDEP